jgi:hypothetical protein
MSVETTKSWYTSKAIWGGILAIVVPIMSTIGYQMTDGDVGELANIITSVATAIGGVIAIWGRISATKAIK